MQGGIHDPVFSGFCPAVISHENILLTVLKNAILL
jgi:hypothetical protein